MHTDMKKSGWITRLPRTAQLYLYALRLDRPVGIFFLLIPCYWGLALPKTSAAFSTYLLFTLGAILMRGAGCVINDLWDRDLDAKVTRTKNRPIASGRLSIRRAIILLMCLLLISFIILLQFNRPTIILGIVSLPLVIKYPLMKRITWWPQAFLGLTFNMGALMGWSAVTGTLVFAPIFLYVSGIFWTLVYDTIYAYQDIEDDMMVGIQSTAIRLKPYGKSILYGLTAVQYLMLCAAIITAGYPWESLLLLIPSIALTVWVIKQCDITHPPSALHAFKLLSFSGWLIAFALWLI